MRMELPAAIALLLRRVRRRWLVRRLLWSGTRAMAAALAALLLAMILADLFGGAATTGARLSGPLGWALFAAAAVAAAAIGLLASSIGRPDNLAVARLVDRRANLKDTLGSAVAFAGLADAPVFARLCLAQADRAAAVVEPRRLVRLSVPRRSLAVAVFLAAVAAAWLAVGPVERWRMARGGGRVRLNAVARDAAESTAQDLDRAAAERPDSLRGLAQADLAAAARDLRDLVAEAAAGRLSLDAALTRLGQLDSRLADAGDAAWLDRLAAALQKAGKALRGHALTDEAGRHLQHGRPAQAEDPLRRLADAVKQTGETALGPTDLAEVARRMNEAAEATREAAPDLSCDLEAAAEDLDAGRRDQVAERIRAAAGDLQGLDREKQRLEMLKRAAGEVARLREAARAGVPPQGEQRWARLMEEVPESLRRTVLPTAPQAGPAEGPTGIGTADTGPGANGQPTRLEGRRHPEQAIGQPAEEGAAVARILRGITEGDAPTVSYRQVYAEYAGQVEAALAGETVPLGYRFYVRRYFRGIRPSGESASSDADP